MKKYKVFISHSWKYVNDLNKLRNLLEQRGYFNVEFTEVPPDCKINSSNAYYIKKRLKEKIKSSDVVLGIAGMYASYSDWMNWELSTAISEGKKVIGVVPHGAQRVSTIVAGYSNDIVRWNTESIVRAIRKNS